MAEAHDVTATQAAEQLSQNVWVKLLIGVVLIALVPGALYGKNYLDQRFDIVDRRFAAVEEKLSTAALKDRNDDNSAAEFKARLGMLEALATRGREDREKFQLQTLAVLQALQSGQQRQAEILSGLAAGFEEFKRMNPPGRRQ